MKAPLSIDEIDRLVEEQISAARVPGLALAIVHDRQLLHARGFGVTSVEDDGLPVTPHTLFAIGSVTKPFVAIAIMRLVEAGALDLDEPVRTYLPWFALSDPHAADVVTLRMLLSHTAGLPTSYDPFGRRSPKDLEAYVRDVVPDTVSWRRRAGCSRTAMLGSAWRATSRPGSPGWTSPP